MALIKVKAKNLEVGDVFVGLKEVGGEPINGKLIERDPKQNNMSNIFLTVEVNSHYTVEIYAHKNSKATISTLRK